MKDKCLYAKHMKVKEEFEEVPACKNEKVIQDLAGRREDTTFLILNRPVIS